MHHHATDTDLLNIINQAEADIQKIRTEYKLSDTDLGTDQAMFIFKGGTVPIVEDNNGDRVELKFIEKTLTADQWGGGWDVKIAFTDNLGNIYAEDGRLLIVSEAGQEAIDTDARIDR